MIKNLLLICCCIVITACSGPATIADEGPTQKQIADAALDDPDNILSTPTVQLGSPDAIVGGVLRRVLTSESNSFNWLIENSVDIVEIQDYVHDGFTRQDPENPDNYMPRLAYKVTVNDDHTSYTVHLREDVYWQIPSVDLDHPDHQWLREPREVIAEDAAFYFEMAQNPEVGAGHLWNYVEDIEQVEILDRYTFRVDWQRPVYHSRLTTLLAYPVPKWLYTRTQTGEEIPTEEVPANFRTHWSNEYPIGTGPYRFTHYQLGIRIVLERNQDFWGAPPPINRIEYQIVYDSEAQFARLLRGQIDLIPNLSPARYRSEILHGESDSPFQTGQLKHEVLDRFAYYYIGWNHDDPRFDDRQVRKAMTLALNREGIIENIYHGLGKVQKGPYFHDHPANDPDIEALPFDLERAAELLDEAGWTDLSGDGIREKEIDGEIHEFSFSLTAYNRPDARSWAAIYAQDLRRIGVHMEVEPVGWPSMQRQMEAGDFQAFTGGWGLSWEISLYQIWHSSQADIPNGSNRVGFRHEEADELIEELQVTFEPDKRVELLRRFHRIVHEEQPYTFFHAPQLVVAWNPRLENVIFQKIRPQTFSLHWYFGE